jgi:hypothetical protein
MSAMGGTHDIAGPSRMQSAITTSISTAGTVNQQRRQLGRNACKQIDHYVLIPILREEKLKAFKPLVESVPRRIANKHIVCLRDLEKTLLSLAPVSKALGTHVWDSTHCFFLPFEEIFYIQDIIYRVLRIYNSMHSYSRPTLE